MMVVRLAVSVLVVLVCLALAKCSTSMEDRFDNVNSMIAALHKKNAEMANLITDMESQIDDAANGMVELKDRIGQLEETKDRVADEIDNLKQKNTGLSLKRQLHTATICFSAVISKTDLTHLQPGQPIVFDQAITNVGDAYNVTSGEFTAPISGLYVFNMDAMVEDGENEYLEFVKDSSHVMYNYAHASGALHDASSSRQVVLDIKGGNKVWVRITPGTHHGSGNLHGNGFSTFSGWLLAITE